MSADNYRTFDGRGNNLNNPDWGQAGTPLQRLAPNAYADGIKSLAKRGKHNPNPRVISNEIFRQTTSIFNSNGLSDFVWAWGQFVDHELDLTVSQEEDEVNIDVPVDDPIFEDTQIQGIKFIIPFSRSRAVPGTGTSRENPRQQGNESSSYLDGSMIYGSSKERADALRTFDGTGRLKSSASNVGELLPYNVDELENEDNNDPSRQRFFIAGDIRANEHSVLTSIHTLFVREHNRVCLDLVTCDPGLAGADETIYQQARKYVGGIIQSITFNEFLPTLLGNNGISAYTGYNPEVNAGVANEFSTVAFRLGHSMLSPEVVLGERGRVVRLRDIFFKPYFVRLHGIEPVLDGLSLQRMQEVDAKVVEDVRSFLFGPPNPALQMLQDLVARNIQRGRDHGIADYNTCRETFGLRRYTNFSEITCDKIVENTLRELYKDIDCIDPWVGALAEDRVIDSNVGSLILAILADQFERVRDGDRFWYENDNSLTIEQKIEIESTRLSDIIRRNTDVNDISDNVFVVLD
ncbi:MAG: peroxiredoxin [Gammaproteobacteria bacterium]|nr:peroxiredoxin [Gammaproteobacteria bacterium]